MPSLFSRSSGRIFRVSGTVIGKSSQVGQAGLRVEAWDKDLLFDDFVAETTSSNAGTFQLEFGEDRFRKLFVERQPDLYFGVSTLLNGRGPAWADPLQCLLAKRGWPRGIQLNSRTGKHHD